MQRIGVIDIGSNTIRLVVYEVSEPLLTGGERVTRHQGDPGFEIIMDESIIAGLSSYVEAGTLSDRGIAKACDSIDDLKARADLVSCRRLFPFATAAIRNCTNSRRVVREIEDATGLAIDVLSGEEEAELGFVGASIGMDMHDGVLVDLGGGSAEVTLISEGVPSRSRSIPMGCVVAYARYVSMVFPTMEEAEAIERGFEELARESGILDERPERTFYGLGGGTLSIARMLAQMHGSSEPEKVVTHAGIRKIASFLEEDPSSFAHTAIKAVPGTVHMLIPACVIFGFLMDAFGCDVLHPCKHGIREGYLVSKALPRLHRS